MASGAKIPKRRRSLGQPAREHLWITLADAGKRLGLDRLARDPERMVRDMVRRGELVGRRGKSGLMVALDSITLFIERRAMSKCPRLAERSAVRRLLTIAEAAKRLALYRLAKEPERVVQTLIRQRKLVGVRVGRWNLVEASSIDAFLHGPSVTAARGSRAKRGVAPGTDRLILPAEAARRLGLHLLARDPVRVVHDMARRGDLRAVRVGRWVMIAESSVDAFIDARCDGGRAAGGGTRVRLTSGTGMGSGVGSFVGGRSRGPGPEYAGVVFAPRRESRRRSPGAIEAPKGSNHES